MSIQTNIKDNQMLIEEVMDTCSEVWVLYLLLSLLPVSVPVWTNSEKKEKEKDVSNYVQVVQHF